MSYSVDLRVQSFPARRRTAAEKFADTSISRSWATTTRTSPRRGSWASDAASYFHPTSRRGAFGPKAVMARLGLFAMPRVGTERMKGKEARARVNRISSGYAILLIINLQSARSLSSGGDDRTWHYEAGKDITIIGIQLYGCARKSSLRCWLRLKAICGSTP